MPMGPRTVTAQLILLVILLVSCHQLMLGLAGPFYRGIIFAV